VFRYQAMDDILELLITNPDIGFSVTQLRNITGNGGEAVSRALDVLESLELITTKREGRKRLIHINQERANVSQFGLNLVPEEFYGPIYAFLREQEDRVEKVRGIVLFGSVARDEADRRSDIDLFVLVEENPTHARREFQRIVQELENRKFDGDRYEYEVLVESVDGARDYADRLLPIFSEGLTLYETDTLQRVKEGVFDARK